MRARWIAGAIVLAAAAPLPTWAALSPGRPNIVLMFPDNLGWGEVGVYGSVRGVPTPNIDSIAASGIRLDNFNVEFSCTVSRAALLTGRYAIRSARRRPPGITQWEVTIAEVLKPAGYATALFGKWHLGGTNWIEGRTPIDQGFDEWYGIPNTSNEAQTTTMPGYDPAKTEPPYIWEQKRGGPAKQVKVFDLDHAAHARPRSGAQEHRLHGTERRSAQAVLSLLSAHAGALPDAAASGLRGQDRRRRHWRRDGRCGLQRRAHSQRSAQARARRQHHGALVHGQRRRGQASVAWQSRDPGAAHTTR